MGPVLEAKAELNCALETPNFPFEVRANVELLFIAQTLF